MDMGTRTGRSGTYHLPFKVDLHHAPDRIAHMHKLKEPQQRRNDRALLILALALVPVRIILRLRVLHFPPGRPRPHLLDSHVKPRREVALAQRNEERDKHLVDRLAQAGPCRAGEPAHGPDVPPAAAVAIVRRQQTRAAGVRIVLRRGRSRCGGRWGHVCAARRGARWEERVGCRGCGRRGEERLESLERVAGSVDELECGVEGKEEVEVGRRDWVLRRTTARPVGGGGGGDRGGGDTRGGDPRRLGPPVRPGLVYRHGLRRGLSPWIVPDSDGRRTHTLTHKLLDVALLVIHLLTPDDRPALALAGVSLVELRPAASAAPFSRSEQRDPVHRATPDARDARPDRLDTRPDHADRADDCAGDNRDGEEERVAKARQDVALHLRRVLRGDEARGVVRWLACAVDWGHWCARVGLHLQDGRGQ
jgi:hypothetical protein